MFLAVINDHFSEANQLATDTEWAYNPVKIAKSLKAEVSRIVLGTREQARKGVTIAQAKPTRALIDQGDEEIIEKLKNFKETKGIPTLTIHDLAGALGNPPESVLTRVMARFDADKSGTIDLEELEMQVAEVDAKSALKNALQAKAHPSLALSDTIDELHDQFDNLESLLKTF